MPKRAAKPWERVTAALRREILTGTPSPGSQLPPIKDLMRVHGVCHRTVRRALHALAQEGLALPHGRHVRVAELPPHARSRSDVVLIALGENGQPGLITPRSHEHLRALEQECGRLNVRLRVVTNDMVFDNGNSPKKLLDDLRALRPLGVVLWRLAFVPDAFRTIVNHALESGVPLAVLDETGDASGLMPRHTEITAWVAENDPLALECMWFLQHKGVDVPGRISVAGLDDGMEAMMRGLTSYNFGGDAVTRAMLAFLLRPAQRAGTGETIGAVELPGRIVERQTTGPAQQ